MKAFITAAIALNLLGSVANASECKGLAEDACGKDTACKWLPAHKAGDISPSSHNPYKNDRKAFCRAGSKTTAAASPQEK